MRSAQILAVAGLAAAQSTTIVLSNGIATTIVLPVWDTNSEGAQVGSASVTLAVPTGDATATLVVDETDIATVTATDTPTSFVTVPTAVTATGTGATPPAVTVSGASSLSAKSLVGLLAAAVAGLALL